MTRKTREEIEGLSGLGKVYKENDWLADVLYGLSVEQEFFAKSGTGKRPVKKDIEGWIQVNKGERNLMKYFKGPFTLHLEDGRKWDFVLSGEGDLLSGHYQVIHASGEGLVESQT